MIPNRFGRALIFVFSIVVFPNAVKVDAADLPNVSPTAQKSDLRDSVKDTNKKEMADLIHFMTTNGKEGRIGENLAPVIGLPKAMPAKSKSIRDKSKGAERNALNCVVIYEESSTEPTADATKPSCIYLMKVTESPRIKDSQFFRVSLDGKLERVITNRIQKDEGGAIIPGSGVATDDDPKSSVVQKAFAAEMSEVKAWLKKEQKVAAKKSPAAKAALKQ